MFCTYLEHTFIDTSVLADLHERAEHLELPEQASSGMTLATCHRIEVFSQLPIKPNLLRDVFGYEGKHVIGDAPVFKRMLEIGTGLRSQLLGEKFILEQFRQSVQKLPVSNGIRETAEFAAATAKSIRDKYGFYAQFDYEELVFDYFAASASRSMDAQSRTLIIVGSGMLARAIARRAPQYGFRNTLIVSRVAKQLRKQGLDLPLVGLYKAANIPSQYLETPYVTFIATTDMTGSYRDAIIALLQSQQFCGIVDMSSIPLDLPKSAGLQPLTMYDPRYIDAVGRANEALRPLAPKVAREVDAHTMAYLGRCKPSSLQRAHSHISH